MFDKGSVFEKSNSLNAECGRRIGECLTCEPDALASGFWARWKEFTTESRSTRRKKRWKNLNIEMRNKSEIINLKPKFNAEDAELRRGSAEFVGRNER